MRDPEQLVQQFEKYCSVLKKVTNPESVERLVEQLGQRLLMCPRGLTENDGGEPGGLIEFSLAVAGAAKGLKNQFGHTKSLVKVALLHELGRAGDLEDTTDLYVIQESDWHREKLGQVYKYNENCSRMNIAHRTLWLISHFQFELTREEWVAINVSQGLHLPENQFYGASLDAISAGLLSARFTVLHGQDN